MPAVTSAAPWAQFVAIGLGPKHVQRSRVAAALVTAYRGLGFVVLAAIVVVLAGYLATAAFYLVNRTWIVPAVVSPSDDRVLALEAELSAHQTQRDRVAAELGETERAIASHERFLRELSAAIKTDLAGRQAALARIRLLATSAAATRRHVQTTNRNYSAQRSARLAREYRAGLVDRGRMLDGKQELAQISTSSLSLAERQANLDTRADELASAVSGLGALAGEHGSDGPLSYDVLTIKRDHEAAKLALASALAMRALLAASLERSNALIANLEQSAHLRAVRDRAAVAVVPYDNLANVSAGAPLYACRAAMVLCRRVGSVLDVLPGEVSVRHPHRERQLRGRMIELRLDDAEAAQDDVLFVGGAPLWL